MSLGLQLRGVLCSTAASETPTLQLLESWFRDKCHSLLRKIRVGDEDGVSVLLVDLHPAAETLRLWFENDTDIVASAQTSSAGPGYHIYVCDLLKRLSGEFGIRWNCSEEDGDETGYFESGDRSSLYREMLTWLGNVCNLILHDSDFGATDLAIAMPTGIVYKANQFLITQMGPRSRQWAETVALQPVKGKDFFAWWTPIPDAEYYLSRALCLMWTIPVG